MTTNEDKRIQADVNDRLAAELPADAAQIQVELRVAKSRWPEP